MTPYIVTYIDDDENIKETLVYAVDEETAMKVVEDALCAVKYKGGNYGSNDQRTGKHS